MSEIVRAGFIPLLDAAPLIVAARLGFAEAEGLTLDLARETSWANIRDRVAIGHFDVAHMLAPIPVAAALGLLPLAAPMIAPFSFGLGGNAVTLSRPLWQALAAAGAGTGGAPAAVGAALAQVIAARLAAGQPQLTLAVVFPFSAHNYELRYWLAACGIEPDRDVRIVVVPPPFVVDALREGVVDGVCVGEPWNSLAVEAGVGVIAVTGAAIWRSGPEKVLGMRTDWAESHAETLAALLRALYHASLWCGAPQNRAELARLLAGPDLLDKPAPILEAALDGRQVIADVAAGEPHGPLLTFGGPAATFPWASHALWFYSQMVRWGHAGYRPDAVLAARRAYRPDLYRAALKPWDVDLPSANAKVEGALTAPTAVASTRGRLVLGPDGFFDGRIFDPDRIEEYLAGFADGPRGDS
ncbi:CmpA/NrtA family ABC transporter substrate-binding protein [Chelatococcus reniformis]|uniref:Nitrate transporter n=1 Tax=Chelatococcus reniformis TaxID=1494448 RepID=A0A916UXQ0_9HYPH|nr:CmpA/NrtA family ABC transporter substrate-binding protein [Chelatococcus reniformis]GGC92365.1 nitrate transporter [Chelatococcus reniformis]